MVIRVAGKLNAEVATGCSEISKEAQNGFAQKIEWNDVS